MRTHRNVNIKTKKQSSKITNGKSLWLPGTDGRGAVARRTRDIFDAICRDLGGHDMLSEAQTQLCRRASLISIKCEEMEARSVQGNDIDLDVYGKLTDRLGRCLQRVGVKRIPKDVTPTLAQYLAEVE